MELWLVDVNAGMTFDRQAEKQRSRREKDLKQISDISELF
jgi:hypothetical protein